MSPFTLTLGRNMRKQTSCHVSSSWFPSVYPNTTRRLTSGVFCVLKYVICWVTCSIYLNYYDSKSRNTRAAARSHVFLHGQTPYCGLCPIGHSVTAAQRFLFIFPGLRLIWQHRAFHFMSGIVRIRHFQRKSIRVEHNAQLSFILCARSECNL